MSQNEFKRVSGKSNGKNETKNKEQFFYAQNAKSIYETILELKTFGSVSGKKDYVQMMLEDLAPTTLYKRPNQGWITFGWDNVDSSYAMEDSFSAPLGRSQRLRISNENCYKVFTTGRKGGVEGYPIFSTYSKKQRGAMNKMNKKVGLPLESIKLEMYRYLRNPVLHHRSYQNIRDHIWANYMGFCQFDLLTRLWRTNKSELKSKFYEDMEVQEYAIKCYLNELRIIDDWKFDKDIVDLFNDEDKSLKAIQQILRGYATSVFILISQPRVKRIPPPVEFEFGKFRFPTYGLKENLTIDGVVRQKDPGDFTDINDLALFSISVELGILSLEGLKNILFDYIGERISSYTDGINNSNFRPPGDMIVYEYMGSCEDGIDFDTWEKIANYYISKDTEFFGGPTDFCGCLLTPERIHKEVGLKTFYRIAEDLRKNKRFNDGQEKVQT